MIGQTRCQIATAGQRSELLPVMIEMLLDGTPEDFAGALPEFACGSGARGAEVALVTESGEQISILRCGNLGHGRYLQQAAEFYREKLGADNIGRRFSAVLGENPHLACYALVRSEEILLVVVVGDAGANFRNLSPPQALLLLLDRAVQDRIIAVKSSIHHSTPRLMEFPTGYIVGFSPAMTLLHQEIFSLSDSDLPVLIVGETGVGKEHYARLVHMWSKRRDAPFVPVNCAAIPAELLEVEMFGIGRGIATGVSERAGYFQLAKGGTLFLDEIAELSLPLQAKMLRALEEREIHRVGGTTVEINVRFVAATNTQLRQAVREGRFRDDLYYRLTGAEVYITPLRSREEDIILLMRHFMDTAAREACKSIQGITPEAVELLRSYSWPGNVRELQHEMRRLVYLCPDGLIIDHTMLPNRIINAENTSTRSIPPKIRPQPRTLTPLTLSDHVEELEARLIRLALTQTRGNQTRAAQLLGISRNGLAIKMQRLRIMINPPSLDHSAE